MTKERRKAASTIIDERSDKPNAPNERHYVDNKKLYAALVERKELVEKALENGEMPPRVSDYIGESIMLIAKNLANKHQFFYYYYKEDMVMDAVCDMLKAVDKFDPNRTQNPFAFFTQSCYFAFINRINKENDETYKRCKMTQDAVNNSLLAETDGNNDVRVDPDSASIPDGYEKYIQDYEERAEKRRQRAEERKQKAAAEQQQATKEANPMEEYYSNDQSV